MGTSGIGIRVWDGTQDINGRPIKPGPPVAPPPQDMKPRVVDRKKIKAGRKVAARTRRKR